MDAINPFAEMPIYGPWRVCPFDGQRRRQLFSSLTHWYESSALDERAEPDLHSAALLMPSPKLVRKFIARHADKVRIDWPMIRGKVLLQGLMFAQLQYPQSPVWKLPTSQLTELLSEHGLRERLLPSLVDMFARRGPASRVLVLGAASAPPKEVGRRINALHKRLAGNWVLVHWMGRHAAWEMHDWADSNHLGMTIHGEPGQRLTPALVNDLLGSCDQVLIFERKGGRALDRVIQAAKGACKPCEVATWVDPALLPLPETQDLTPVKVRREAPRKKKIESPQIDDLFS